MLKEGHTRVCVVGGGFFAVHEYIRRIQRMDWLIDHEDNACPGINTKLSYRFLFSNIQLFFSPSLIIVISLPYFIRSSLLYSMSIFYAR